MGSKAKITKYIVPIIQRKIDESGARYYVEPFAGGCNVIDKIKAEYRIASDSNKYLIALFQHLQDGGELPEHITREEYNKAREAYRTGGRSQHESKRAFQSDRKIIYVGGGNGQ